MLTKTQIVIKQKILKIIWSVKGYGQSAGFVGAAIISDAWINRCEVEGTGAALDAATPLSSWKVEALSSAGEGPTGQISISQYCICKEKEKYGSRNKSK